MRKNREALQEITTHLRFFIYNEWYTSTCEKPGLFFSQFIRLLKNKERKETVKPSKTNVVQYELIQIGVTN